MVFSRRSGELVFPIVFIFNFVFFSGLSAQADPGGIDRYRPVPGHDGTGRRDRGAAVVARDGVQRLSFSSVAGRSLQIEILSDTLIHAEVGPQAAAAAPQKQEQDDGSVSEGIPSSPMIVEKNFRGPTRFNVLHDASGLPDAFETAALRVTVDPTTLCLDFFDIAKNSHLTVLCPKISSGTLTGLTISKEKMEDAYGLGEQFLTAGQPNGDWVGQERTPGGSVGNALTAFRGGHTENAQFPILYAVGAGTLNYALFVDQTEAQTWNLTGDPWTMDLNSQAVKFYFVAGQDLPALRSQYMELTGLPPIPPKKAMGLWVSEFGYHDWLQMEDKLRTLRKNHFPIDGFVLDLFWFGPFNGDTGVNSFGKLEFDETHFPNPAATISYLRDHEGIGLATIEESYVDEQLDEYKWLADQGYFVKTTGSDAPVPLSSWWGKGSMIDWTSDRAAAAWHDLKRQKIVDEGVMIHWTDLGEPETYSDQDLYSGVAGVDGRGETEMHNLYSFKWSEGIAKGYARNHVARRPFILSRSGTSGIQRFGDALWSGDIGSNLASLSAHLNVQMQMSFSGIDYFGCDVGGFNRLGLEGNLSEVYTRWFAHSSLFDFPVRPHADDGSGKNYTAPDRIGDLKSNLFNIRQRYELSPYYYSLAYLAHTAGEPIIPPPVYYFQSDENLRKIGDEKMIGKFLLAATGAVDGQQDRSVYLPKGAWFEVHTESWYESDGTSFAGIPEFQNGIYRLPLFAREGAIIPKMKLDDKSMNILGKRTDGSVDTDLRLMVVPSATPTAFTLYEDDSETVNYLKGDFATTLLSQNWGDDSITVTVAPTQGTFKGQALKRATRLDVYFPTGVFARVLVNGAELQQTHSKKELEAAPQGWWIAGQNHIIVRTDSMAIQQAKTIEITNKRRKK